MPAKDYYHDTVKRALIKAMNGYARKGLNSQSGSFVSLLVRLLADTIIVEHDQNDKPLVDALVQAGIPRSQIILTYAGEAAPESA